MDWQDQAARLGFGQKRKVQHCGTSPSAYLSNSTAGISLHCFRCGEHQFEPHGRLSGAAWAAMREAESIAASSRHPTNVSISEAPDAAFVWLLQAGIMPERAENLYGFAWAPDMQRVTFSLMHDGSRTSEWSARTLDGRKPKYLMPRGAQGRAWRDLRPEGPLVLVEDVLSAIRVHEAGYAVMAILGTSPSPAQCAATADRDVIAWFDGDTAGRDAFVKLRRRLAPFGVSPRWVRTPRDPKLYSKADIQAKLEGTLMDNR